MDLTKLTKEELLSLKTKLEYDISKYHNFQLVKKIQLNSAYGAIGNQYFRYYSTDIAEAITVSGQLSIQYIGNELNAFLNKNLGTTDIDYIIASDTDSVYLNLGSLVKKYLPNETDDHKICSYLDKCSKNIILPLIEKKFNELSSTMNAYENKMVMARESIANKGIWTAKNRYNQKGYDSEGVKYSTPELKIMGIETTRSSTPELVRNDLKKCIDIMLNHDEDYLITFIENIKKNFFSMSAENIAFPRRVNGLEKYRDSYYIYKKSTPIAVKGALIYNHHINKMKLEKKYKLIQEGEKIKFVYLKTPNPFGGMYGDDHIVSFPNKVPKEFELEAYIDYAKQFEKSFLDPLATILNTIGWSYEKKTTLESLFN